MYTFFTTSAGFLARFSGTTNENELKPVTQRVTPIKTSGNEWQRVVQQMKTTQYTLKNE